MGNERSVVCLAQENRLRRHGGGRRGNPCLFPARFFPELLALTGDCGGSRVIRQHEDELMLLEVDARELADVDTPQALAEVEREMRQI